MNPLPSKKFITKYLCSPQFTNPIYRCATLAITLIIIVLIETGRQSEQLFPIPFLLLYSSVALASNVGGLRFGLTSALIASSFIVYSATISFGPPTLTGGVIPVTFGIVLHIITALLIGRTKDHQKRLVTNFEILLDQNTKTLKDNEVILDNIIHNIPALVHIKDIDGRYIQVNHQYEQVFKLKNDEIAGKTAYDVLPKQLANQLNNNHQRVIDTNVFQQVEEQIRQESGGLNTYLTIYFPLPDGSGNINAICGISTNINERKKTEDQLRKNEERYRQTLEAISDYAYSMEIELDNSIHLEWLTGHPEKVLGYTVEEFTDGSIFNFAINVTQPEYRELLQQSFEDILNNKRTSIEVICKHKDGRDVWLRINRQPIWDDTEQRVIRYYGAVIDITQEKKAEEALIEQEYLQLELEKEKELSTLRNNYLSTIAHDFRTPLTSISMASDILDKYKHKLTEEQRQNAIKRIFHAIDYLDKMLNTLSLIARSERGYLQFQPQLINFHIFCEQIVNDFIEMNETQHQIILNSTDLNKTYCLDEDMFHHIFANLLSNAVKYSPIDSIITITISEQQSNLLISITDNGIGIPQEDISRLFDPFHRAQNVGSIKGSGVGLSIVQRMILAHNGSISCDSTEGVGTTFTIIIPINNEGCEN